jgi:peroxiredoxin
MTSEIEFNGNKYKLVEDFTDIGYMADNFEANDFHGNSIEVKRSHANKAMTVLVSFPKLSQFTDEVLALDKLFSELQVDVYCYLIFDKDFEDKTAIQNRLNKFQMIFDEEEEFGNMYGTKIIDKDLKNELAKSLFLISKDGAIFYLDFPQNLDKPFDLDRLAVELNKAFVTYNGQGCHG